MLYHADVRKGMTRLMAFPPPPPQLLFERAELLHHATWQAYTNITFSQIFRHVLVIATFRQVNCERTVIITWWQTETLQFFVHRQPLTLKPRFIYMSIIFKLMLTHNPFFLWPVSLHLGPTPIRYKEFQAQDKVYSCIGFCSRLYFYNVVLFRFIFGKKSLILSHKLWGSKQRVLASPPCMLLTNRHCVRNKIYKFDLTQLYYIKCNVIN
jgi:hypothetical protein